MMLDKYIVSLTGIAEILLTAWVITNDYIPCRVTQSTDIFRTLCFQSTSACFDIACSAIKIFLSQPDRNKTKAFWKDVFGSNQPLIFWNTNNYTEERRVNHHCPVKIHSFCYDGHGFMIFSSVVVVHIAVVVQSCSCQLLFSVVVQCCYCLVFDVQSCSCQLLFSVAVQCCCCPVFFVVQSCSCQLLFSVVAVQCFLLFSLVPVSCCLVLLLSSVFCCSVLFLSVVV